MKSNINCKNLFTISKDSAIIYTSTLKEIVMDGKIFKLTKIEGEYAYLTPIDSGDDVFIALALLPVGADVGTMLICESFQFSIYE